MGYRGGEAEMKKGPWKVTSNSIGDKLMYGVCRIINPNEVEHSGNREMYGDYMDSREEAAAIVDRLNKEKEPSETAQ